VIGLNWNIPRRLWVEAQIGKARTQTLTPEQKIAATGQRVIGLRDKYDGDYAKYLEGFGLAA